MPTKHPGRHYRYSWFCEHYGRWAAAQDEPSVRQLHRAGEKCFVDCAGAPMEIVDQATGEIRKAQLFVGVLGASSYAYVEATWTQQSRDWLGSHVRMLEYFGGVPEVVVCDNLRADVKRVCRYVPELELQYQQWVAQVAEQWILPRMRNHQFFTL